MRNFRKAGTFILILSGIFCSAISYSQDNDSLGYDVGADFYSGYICWGTKYGTGPVVKLLIEYSEKFFNGGAWGSFDFSGYQEADIFVTFSLPGFFPLV